MVDLSLNGLIFVCLERTSPATFFALWQSNPLKVRQLPFFPTFFRGKWPPVWKISEPDSALLKLCPALPDFTLDFPFHLRPLRYQYGTITGFTRNGPVMVAQWS